MQADLTRDDGHAIMDHSDTTPPTPTRVRGIPTGYRMKTFTNEFDQDKEIPRKRCAVCCRLLYKEEYYVLWRKHQIKIEEQFNQDQSAALANGASPESTQSMTWPLLNYRDHKGKRIRELDMLPSGKKANGKHAGAVIVCARHKSGGSQSLATIINYMRFTNEKWMYPGDQTVEIRDLNPIGEGYLCPLLVFCELTNSRSKLTPASRAGYHFVSGRISLCKSKRYFGSHAGTRGLIKLSDMDVKMSIDDKQRICIAWYWLKENHPLIKGLDIEEPSDLTNASETLVEDNAITEEGVDMTRLGACHMGPVGTGGPTTADKANNLGNLTIGLLGRDQKVVKYSNPCLLGYLFPTLYPRGQGFYSLDYEGVKRGTIDQIEVYDESMGDNKTYLDEQVEAFDEEHLFLSENDGDESADQEKLSDSDSDDGDADVDSDLSDSEELDAQIQENSSNYSKSTIKNYAKFRLLNVDRRWGRNIKFILMMFDWIQKSAIFAYQRRLARSSTGGRLTRAEDVLDQSFTGQGVQYRESRTVAIPPFIRTGLKYKSALFQKFSALFDEFGSPQMFGTFTCDDRSAGQVAVARHFGGPNANTHDDPVLFTMHWKRQWLRFWKFVTSTRKGREGWAMRRTGGIRAWCWVFELQDRGTPHTHFCLWTKNSIQQMISDEIITCSLQEKAEDQALVMKHQIHNCTAYCHPDGRETCRLKYPRPASDLPAYLDEEGRYVLPRGQGEERVNGYNLDLLRFGRVNMDLQYNEGDRAKYYMCKYVTEQAGPKQVTIVTDKDKTDASTAGMSSSNEDRSSKEYITHFHYRSVGVVEAVMDICGWKMHGCSRVDEFLPTELPENRRRILKRVKDLRNLVNATDIFLDDKWTQYLKRPRSQEGGLDFDGLTYRDYFKNFRFGKRKAGPNYIDGRGRDVCRRADGKEALIRTREIRVTNAEDAFMHLLMLNHPWRSDVDSWIGVGKDHETYQSLALDVLGRDRIGQLAEGLLVVLDYGNVYENPVIEPAFNLPTHIKWTEDQMNVLDMVKFRLQSRQDCLILVTGAAGTGKSTVLEEIHRIAKSERFEPIRLAPSGVAAVNIKGQTLHRWFRLTKLGRQFPEGNSYDVRLQLMDIADQGLRPIFLIDEVSMISGAILSALSKTLQEAANVDSGVPFGGFPVILFGDFGQLGPVNKSSASTDWVWNAKVYNSFERVDLIQPCRQSGDLAFKSMLDDIRCGNITTTMVTLFLEICSQSKSIPEDAIHLFPKKKEVEELNLDKLKRLPGGDWFSIASDNAKITMDASKRDAIEAETGLMSVLWLRVGARVMCTSNVDVAGGVVNGTTGKVVRFYGQHVVQVKEDTTGRIFSIQKECRRTKFSGQERRQFPLILAWALTIHKSQSLTLNKVVVNLSDVFASGQSYVAMSRVRTRGDLFINDWSAEGLLSVKHAVKTRLTKLSEASRTAEDEEIEKREELQTLEDDYTLEVGPESLPEVGLTEHGGLNEMQLQGWEDIVNSVLSYQDEHGGYFADDGLLENVPSPSPLLPLSSSLSRSNLESNQDLDMTDDELLEGWEVTDSAQLDDGLLENAPPPSPLSPLSSSLSGSSLKSNQDLDMTDDERLEGWEVKDSAQLYDLRNDVISEEDTGLKEWGIGTSSKFDDSKDNFFAAEDVGMAPKSGALGEDMFIFRSSKRTYSDSDSNEPTLALNNGGIKNTKKRKAIPAKKRARRGSSAARDSDNDDDASQGGLGSVSLKRRAAVGVADIVPRKRRKDSLNKTKKQ